MRTKVWSKGRKVASLARGPHKSAKYHIPFLRIEYCDMIKKGHFPAKDVLHMPKLCLSPLGWFPRGLTGQAQSPTTVFFGVNEDMVPLAPKEAMQFGKVLPRLLQCVHDANPKFGPVYMSKIDIVDGFYRLDLQLNMPSSLVCYSQHAHVNGNS